MSSDQSDLQSYLSKEEFRKVADTRRSFWTGGFQGFVAGASLGGVAYYANTVFKKFPSTRNHAFLLVLAGGGFGMFAGSYLGATKRRQDLHTVLRQHKDERLAETFHDRQIEKELDPWDARHLPDDAPAAQRQRPRNDFF
eukprot:INCI1167.2.p1 GENE.INCI1167.2~~INCI1167.2.p1  ORF type:complete len:140 (+),score=21.28 INCI1167.2:347-766(+)